MRVLLWPTFSYPGNIGGDSLYLIARNLIRAADPSVMWVLIVPDTKSVPVDDLDDMPNVQKVRTPMGANYRVQEAAPDPEIIWKYQGAIGLEPVDMVISMSPHRSVNLANAWGQKSTATSKQLIVTWDLLVRDDGAGEFVATAEELIQQAAGSLMSDVIFHESPVARKMTLSVARKYLSSSSVRSIMAKSTDILQGISVKKVVDLAKGVEKREKFTVYYGGRFSGSKRLADIAEIVDYFYKFGRDVEFVVTTGSLDGMKRANFERDYPQVTLHVGLSQEEAWKIMASCHASLCFSSHELFGMAFWEQMAAGLGVVMLARDWNKELVPPEYDLIVDAPQEAAAQLRRMYELWEEDPAKLEAQHGYDSHPAEWVRENYDADKNLAQMMSILTHDLGEIEAKAYSSFLDGKAAALVETAELALTDVNELTLEEYWAAIRANSRVGANFIGKRMIWGKSNSMLDGLRVARYLGYEDCYIDGKPGLRKSGTND